MGQPNDELAVEIKEPLPEVRLSLDTPVEIAEVREKIKRVVGNQAVQMVETTIAGVGKCNYLAMKYLFEMIGIYPATVSVEPGAQDSLAKILLRNLEIADEFNPESAGLQTEVIKDSLSAARAATGHAVE